MATDQAVATAKRRETASQFQGQGEQRSRFSFAGYQPTASTTRCSTATASRGPIASRCFDRIRSISADDLIRRQRAADRSMVQLGITFNVYGDRQGCERIIPFDIVPRIVCREEWDMAGTRPASSGSPR